MFGVSRADGPPDGALLIAPALAASLQGRDVEEVLLLRDEAANLAWAIERAVEGEHGLPADRAQAAHEAVPTGPAARPPVGHAALSPAHRPAAALVPAAAPARAAHRPVDDLPPRRPAPRHPGRAGGAAAPARPPARSRW